MSDFNRFQQHCKLCPTCNAGDVEDCPAGYAMSIGLGNQVGGTAGLTRNKEEEKKRSVNSILFGK